MAMDRLTGCMMVLIAFATSAVAAARPPGPPERPPIDAVALQRADDRYWETRGVPVKGAEIARAVWLEDGRLAYLAEKQMRLFDPQSGGEQVMAAAKMPPEPADWPAGADVYGSPGPPEIASPDGRWLVTADGPNLLLVNRPDGSRRTLTSDGTLDHAYGDGVLISWSGQLAVKRAGMAAPPSLLWSPQSDAILTFRADARKVRRLPLVETVERPDGTPDIILHETRTGFPGEPVVEARYVVIHVPSGRIVDVKLPEAWAQALDPLRYGVAQWSRDGRHVFIHHIDPRGRETSFWRIDAETGEATRVLAEPTVFAMAGWNRAIDEQERSLVWSSDRDGHNHLYHHDLATGRLRNRITTGPIFVHAVLGVRGGWVYYLAAIDDGTGDPYRKDLYRARLDGSTQQRLTRDEADHDATASPGLDYFLVTHRRLDRPLAHSVIATDGRIVRRLSDPRYVVGAPIPERISGIGRGGTRVWGTLMKPSDFDPARRYPVIHLVHGTFGFIISPLGQDTYRARIGQALAELGFIVMVVDGTGNYGRSRANLEIMLREGPGDCGGLIDNVSVMKQLAAERPYMDLSRVGVTGNSNGGYCSTRAMLDFPDDFHVAVSFAGNHDNRLINGASQLHHYLGFPADNPEGYLRQDNAAHAARLKGRLLLGQGMLDEDVHFGSTMRLIDALIRENKDYDFFVVPDAHHTLMRNRYAIRRLWGYFTRHLLGREVPID